MGLIQNGEAMISLDRNDIRSVLVGKEGTLFEAYKEKGVSNCYFMKDFFGALQTKDDVRECSTVLISIGLSPNSPLMMEDMGILNDFFESLDNKDLEAK